MQWADKLDATNKAHFINIAKRCTNTGTAITRLHIIHHLVLLQFYIFSRTSEKMHIFEYTMYILMYIKGLCEQLIVFECKGLVFNIWKLVDSELRLKLCNKWKSKSESTSNSFWHLCKSRANIQRDECDEWDSENSLIGLRSNFKWKIYSNKRAALTQLSWLKLTKN